MCIFLFCCTADDGDDVELAIVIVILVCYICIKTSSAVERYVIAKLCALPNMFTCTTFYTFFLLLFSLRLKILNFIFDLLFSNVNKIGKEVEIVSSL